jgi:hypothetical protein
MGSGFVFPTHGSTEESTVVSDAIACSGTLRRRIVSVTAATARASAKAIMTMPSAYPDKTVVDGLSSGS